MAGDAVEEAIATVPPRSRARIRGRAAVAGVAKSIIRSTASVFEQL